MKFNFSKKNSGKDTRTDIPVNSRQSFLFTEAYKALRTNVLFALPKEGCRKIMITSPLAGEGKSTVSSHLAAAFAEMGSKVLIIDCDLRRGKVHRFFEAKRSPGLANVLAGFIEAEDAIQDTQIENLSIIPAGAVPPNPAELLASGKMDEIVSAFSESYDYIILDTSPVNVVSDALPVASLADGIMIVVRENYTDQTALQKCIASLEFAEGKILGVVFNDTTNKATTKDRRYGYYKGGYYISRKDPNEKK